MDGPLELSRVRAGDAAFTPLLIGETPDPSLLGLPDQSLRIPLPSGLIRRGGRVRVEDLLELAERCVPTRPGDIGKTPVVVVTSRPLSTLECASLFGFSDRRRQRAVVSLAGLAPGNLDEGGDPGSPMALGGPASVRQRMQNLIAHELGHLRGLAHCSSPGCLMNPVRVAHELDDRSFLPCGHCPPLGWWTPWREIFRSSTVPSRLMAETRTP
jgi:hypothetical protein